MAGPAASPRSFSSSGTLPLNYDLLGGPRRVRTGGLLIANSPDGEPQRTSDDPSHSGIKNEPEDEAR